MKTTLKRGIGRSAEPTGTGRAVSPPPIDPFVRRYRQPEPEPRSRTALLAKVLMWIALVALMLSAGIVGGTYLYVERDIAQALEPESLDVKVAQERLDAVIPGEPTIALVVGSDKRVGAESAETGHSDTLMLLRADPETDTVTLLSFPRDLLVDVRCADRPPFVSRINVAYSECGATGSLLTVRELTGLPLNYLITVNFRGFMGVVGNIGGVWVDVDRRYFNDNSQGGERYASIDLMPGYQALDLGTAAVGDDGDGAERERPGGRGVARVGAAGWPRLQDGLRREPERAERAELRVLQHGDLLRRVSRCAAGRDASRQAVRRLARRAASGGDLAPGERRDGHRHPRADVPRHDRAGRRGSHAAAPAARGDA